MLPIVPTDVSDSFDPDRDRRGFRADGDSETLASGTKMPYCAGQSKYLQEKKFIAIAFPQTINVHVVKYLTPSTLPSFLPLASSNCTPHQFPAANLVSPIYCRTPGRLPIPDDTITLSPTAKFDSKRYSETQK